MQNFFLIFDRIKNEYEKRLDDAQKMIADQESHVSLLKGKNQQLEQNAENSKQLQSENEELRQELAEIKRQLESQSLEHRKSVLELKEQHMNETNELKEIHICMSIFFVLNAATPNANAKCLRNAFPSPKRRKSGRTPLTP